MNVRRRYDGTIVHVEIEENDTLKDVASVLPVTLMELINEFNDKIRKYETEKEDD